MRNPKATKHDGSTFDSFLEEENLLEEVEAVAMKRVIAWQLLEAMKVKRVTKKEMARHLKTSRSQIDRLLDPGYVEISLETVSKAAHALGKRIQVQFEDATPAKRKAQTPARKPTRGFRGVSSKSKHVPAVAAV